MKPSPKDGPKRFEYACDRVETEDIDKVIKMRADAGWRLVAVAAPTNFMFEGKIGKYIYRHWWEREVDA